MRFLTGWPETWGVNVSLWVNATVHVCHSTIATKFFLLYLFNWSSLSHQLKSGIQKNDSLMMKTPNKFTKIYLFTPFTQCSCLSFLSNFQKFHFSHKSMFGCLSSYSETRWIILPICLHRFHSTRFNNFFLSCSMISFIGCVRKVWSTKNRSLTKKRKRGRWPLIHKVRELGRRRSEGVL